MADIEKVIKGLEHCTRPTEYGKGGNFCMDCPYTEPIGFNQFKCNSQQMMKDAIELLKKQGAIVRCKDCKFMIEDDVFQCGIKAGYFPVNEDWFCADGKLR